MSKIFDLFPKKPVEQVAIPTRPEKVGPVEWVKAPTRIEALKAAGKLLPAPTPAWVVNVRKEVHAILGFGGHVIHTLDGNFLANALASSKDIAKNAFLQSVQEYFLACQAYGITPDTTLVTPVAKEAYKMAKEAEAKATRESLVFILTEELVKGGVRVGDEVIAQGTKATREHVAQATKSRKMAVREAVANMSEGRVVATSSGAPASSTSTARACAKARVEVAKDNTYKAADKLGCATKETKAQAKEALKVAEQDLAKAKREYFKLEADAPYAVAPAPVWTGKEPTTKLEKRAIKVWKSMRRLLTGVAHEPSGRKHRSAKGAGYTLGKVRKSNAKGKRGAGMEAKVKARQGKVRVSRAYTK
jgi:hypothetical protein